MKQLGKNTWKADSDKIFVRIKDGAKIGSIINLGRKGSLRDYAEVSLTSWAIKKKSKEFESLFSKFTRTSSESKKVEDKEVVEKVNDSQVDEKTPENVSEVIEEVLKEETTTEVKNEGVVENSSKSDE